MPNMDTIRRRTAAGIKEERLAAFITIKNHFEVAMREDDASPKEVVRALASDALKAGQQLSVNPLRAELVDQLVVVDRLDLAVLADLSLHLSFCEYCQTSALVYIVAHWIRTL